MKKKIDKAEPESINNFNAEAGSSYHIIVQVEFNGRNPGGTYYDHLHKMGIWVNRGNREEFPSALNRRLHAVVRPQALVLQEGMFACENDDVARRIANLADECGAEVVNIGRFYSTVYRVSDLDLQAYEQYKKGVGKKGPKNKADIGIYAITCFQEVRTFEAELDAFPFSCSCGSNHFTAHFGKAKSYLKPDWKQEKDVYDYWLRSRFGQGTFEIPLHTGKNKKLPPLTVKDVPEMPALIDVSTGFQKDMDNNPDFALHVWDVMYSLGHFSEDDRFKERLNVINIYIYQGHKKNLFMGVPDGGYDLIDLCILDKDLMKYL